MNLKSMLFSLFVVAFVSSSAQQSAVWEDFKAARKIVNEDFK